MVCSNQRPCEVLEGKLANEICPDACVSVGAPERPVLLAGHAIVRTIKLAEITI